MEEVELIASGYEWTCPNCGQMNKEMETKDKVQCHGDEFTRGCGMKFKVSEAIHAEG